MGPADFLFCNYSPLKVTQALQEYGLEADHFKSSWTCLLVDAGEKTLVIDRGVAVAYLTLDTWQKVVLECKKVLVAPQLPLSHSVSHLLRPL
jgi:hypothetical protein